MNNQKLFLIVSAWLISQNSKAVPKDMDIERILNENSIVFKALKKAGIEPIKDGKKLNNYLDKPEKSTIGENAPRQCIVKERELGNGVIKCKNGYFQE